MQRRRAGAAADVEPRLPEPRDDRRQRRPDRGRQGRLACSKGRDGTRNYLITNTVDVGPGESRDVLFTAPSARRVPALRPQLRLPGQRRRPGLRRHDDRILVGAAGHPRPQTQPQHLTTPTRRRSCDSPITTRPAPGAARPDRGLRRPWSASAPSWPPRLGATRRAGRDVRGPALRDGRNQRHVLAHRPDGYVSTPDGNSIYMWGYGMSSGQLPAARAGPLRHVGPDRHRRPAQRAARGDLDRLPGPEGRQANGNAGPAAVRHRSGTLTSMVQPAAAPRRLGHLHVHGRSARAPTSTRAAPT